MLMVMIEDPALRTFPLSTSSLVLEASCKKKSLHLYKNLELQQLKRDTFIS